MMNRTKLKGAAANPAPRPASPKNRRKVRTGRTGRARSGLARANSRTSVRQEPSSVPETVQDRYGAFYASGEDGVGLLDPGFDDWDDDPLALLGMKACYGTEREDM